MIAAVLLTYYPGWDAPEDDGRTWIPTECPVHGDETPSASVSYDHNAFKCHACGYSGDYLKIIQMEEEIDFAEALARAATIATDSGNSLPQHTKRQSGRGFSRPKRFGSL